MRLNQLLAQPDASAKEVEALLDEMSHAERLQATRQLKPKLFKKLFDLVENARTLSLEDLVPERTPPFTSVRHFGTNNLFAFRNFEKPMYRDVQGRVAGRNVQTWDLLTGPAYFTVQDLSFDYNKLPESKPADWPRVTSNTRGFSYLVFGHLTDVVRKVSRHVLIGHAFRRGKPLAQYFVLVREESG